MNLNIKTLTGTTYSFHVLPSMKIKDIKDFLLEKEGIPKEQNRLIFGGQMLNDELPISSYPFKAGSTVYMILSLRGG